MTGDASSNDLSLEHQNQGNAASALEGYDSDIADYMGNVNSALSAGNPFESKSYLTQQNLATSGAANSATDAANNAEQQTVARTGTNSAALANTEAEAGRQSQRDVTNYNATRDTQNEDTWLQDQQNLLRDQAAGAQSQAGVYGSTLGAENADAGDYTTAEDAEDAMWANLAGAAASGAGVGAGIAMHG